LVTTYWIIGHHFVAPWTPVLKSLGIIFYLIWHHFVLRWGPISSEKSKRKCWISIDSTLTQANKPMTQSHSTVLATPLDQVMTRL